METKEKLIPRLYRITKQQDELVKHNGKIFGGESAYIRRLIDEGVLLKIQWVPVLTKPHDELKEKVDITTEEESR